MEPSRRAESEPRLHLVHWIVGGAVVAALIALVARFGEERRLLEVAARAEPAWLLLAAALQATTYLVEAFLWKILLLRRGRRLPLRELLALSLVQLFTNQALPTAGVAGSAVVVKGLEARGVPMPIATAVVLADLIGFYVAYEASVAVSIALLWAWGGLHPVVLGLATAIALVGITIVGTVLWLTSPGNELPAWLVRIPAIGWLVRALAQADPELLRDPWVLGPASALRTVHFLLAITTLWACLRAVGEPVGLEIALVGFVIGQISQSLGIVPGGLGTFESGTVGGLLLVGVPATPGLAATLLLRGLSFWAPMVPGLWFARRIARQDP